MKKISTYTHQQRQTAFLWAVFGALFFSSKAIFAKLMYREGADAMDVLTLRMVFSLPFFIMIGLWARKTAPYKMTFGDFWQVCVVGFFGNYLSAWLDFAGLQYTSVGLERLIMFLTPSFVLIISKFWLKKQIDHKQWYAMALAYVGVAFVFWHDLSFGGERLAFGSFLIFVSAAAYAMYLLLSGELVKRLGSARLLAYAMTVSTLFSVVHFDLTHDLSSLYGRTLTLYGYSLLFALLGTVAPIVLTMLAISRLGSPIVSQLSMIGPVATLGLGYWFLGEPITTVQLFGTALVIVGIFLVGRVAAERQKATT